LEVVRDALNRETRFAYDAANHLTLITNSDQTQTFFVYNTPGAQNPLTGEIIANASWDADVLLMRIDNYVPGGSGEDVNLSTRYFYTDSLDAPAPANLPERIEAPRRSVSYNNRNPQTDTPGASWAPNPPGSAADQTPPTTLSASETCRCQDVH
jgi:YD repeat-containing protein